MTKICPFLLIAGCSENQKGGIDCIKDKCEMWCLEIEEITKNKKNRHYRAGCGLISKENREC
jgi:hypothetical protein